MDINPCTTYLQRHFTHLLTGATLPGIRGRILHELLPIELTHTIRAHLGFTWHIDRPLPHGIDVAQLRGVISSVRTFTPLVTFQFKGTPGPLPGTVTLEIRLHRQVRVLEISAEAFQELDAPMGEWRTLMGPPPAPKHADRALSPGLAA